MAFKKTSKLDVLATTQALESAAGWRRSASTRGISHFAQANATSVRAILEAVGDAYCISKDPADYIFAVYRAVTQDKPNGNGDAFPRDELLSWNKVEKKPVYRTFEFKPRFVNHQADDPRMARGVCLDTHYNESDPDDCFIEVLVCYDIKKDPILAQAVMDGHITQCSMGCDALRTKCNVCDNIAHSEKDYCVHIKPGNRLKEHRAPDGSMKLAFEWCYDVTFQELSDVDDPADKTADIQEILPVEGLSTAKMEQESEMLTLKARIKRLESIQVTEPAFQMAASQGAGMANQVAVGSEKSAAKKKQEAAPEHHTVAAAYAKHYEMSLGDHAKAMKSAMEECGKSEDEIRAAWEKKSSEDKPHEKHDAICASLNAQLLACGDMKKAIKRAAEDHDVDHGTVEKCAEHMKHSNKMPQAAKVAEAPAAEPAKVEASEPAAVPAEKEAEAPAAAPAEEKEAEMPAEVKEKIDESAKSAALKLQAQAEEPAKEAAEAPVDEKKASDEKEEPAKEAQAAPVEPVASGAAEVVQAQDAPADKSLGDMGVKTSEAEAPADKEAARVANQFPYAKFYQDVTAKKVASGAIHVSRAGKLMFTVPAVKKAGAKDTLSLIASVGLIGAMKKLSAISKQADLGVAEGAVSDVAGGRPVPPQSSQEGAVSDKKENAAAAPASATAQGSTTDMKDKLDTKSLSNSDVRDGAASDTAAGYAASPNSVVDKGENTDAKVKHSPKNVGSDSVLAQHQVDFVTAGLDPRSAKLVRDRLVKAASVDEEQAKKEAQAAEKELAAKKAEEEKEVEKKARHIAAQEKARFVRGLKLAARRFALNLEPCHLKYSMGEVLSSRHEASGYEGMDSDLVHDVVMRGISLRASLDHVDHMVKRGHELAAMPEDALVAVEADVENLEPVAVQASEGEEPVVAHTASSDLRRRAAAGSMPLVRSFEPAHIVPETPTKQSLVRQAIGGGILGRKYPGRH